MIASLFSKTRPINYALIFLMLLSCFFLYQIRVSTTDFTTNILIEKAAVLVLILFSFFLVNFISLKNSLTKNDNYAILIFFIFILLFPTILNNIKIVFSCDRIATLTTVPQDRDSTPDTEPLSDFENGFVSDSGQMSPSILHQGP